MRKDVVSWPRGSMECTLRRQALAQIVRIYRKHIARQAQVTRFLVHTSRDWYEMCTSTHKTIECFIWSARSAAARTQTVGDLTPPTSGTQLIQNAPRQKQDTHYSGRANGSDTPAM